MPAETGLRGQTAHVRILSAGQTVDVIDEITSWEMSRDDQVQKTEIVGKEEHDTDVQPMGWSGRFSFVVKSSVLDKFMDEIDRARHARVGNIPVTIVLIIEYPDGEVTTSVFRKTELTYARMSGAGKSEQLQRELSFTAARRELVN